MKRRGLILAMIGLLVGAVWALYELVLPAKPDREATSGNATPHLSADPMKSPAGWRYRQSQPHHWRYIMLKK